MPEGIGPQDQYQLTIRGQAALPLDALQVGDPPEPLTIVLDGDFL